MNTLMFFPLPLVQPMYYIVLKFKVKFHIDVKDDSILMLGALLLGYVSFQNVDCNFVS